MFKPLVFSDMMRHFVNAGLVDAVVDKFGNSVPVVKSSDEAVDLSVPVRISPQFFGWVAGMDGGVRICAPKRVVTAYRDWLDKLKAQMS